jgi:hypothetical protein
MDEGQHLGRCLSYLDSAEEEEEEEEEGAVIHCSYVVHVHVFNILQVLLCYR